MVKFVGPAFQHPVHQKSKTRVKSVGPSYYIKHMIYEFLLNFRGETFPISCPKPTPPSLPESGPSIIPKNLRTIKVHPTLLSAFGMYRTNPRGPRNCPINLSLLFFIVSIYLPSPSSLSGVPLLPLPRPTPKLSIRGIFYLSQRQHF